MASTCELNGTIAIFSPKPKKKKKNPDPVEEEEIPEDGYGVAAFFDTECRQGEREEEDETVEESMKELLFFDIESRQEDGNHEPNLCIVQDEAGEELMDFSRRQYPGRILRVVVHGRTCQLYGHGAQFSGVRQLFHSAISTRARR